MKLTTSEIKIKYGIGPTTIHKWVKNNKLTIPKNYQKGQPFKIDEDELLKLKNCIGMIIRIAVMTLDGIEVYFIQSLMLELLIG